MVDKNGPWLHGHLQYIITDDETYNPKQRVVVDITSGFYKYRDDEQAL